MREDGYKAKISFVNRELTVREKIVFKDMGDSQPLNNLASGTVITVDTWGTVEIHNPMAENTDYSNTVIITSTGEKYNTSSKSFFNAIYAIFEELEDAGETGSFDIRIMKKQSKNNSGSFITCALV